MGLAAYWNVWRVFLALLLWLAQFARSVPCFSRATGERLLLARAAEFLGPFGYAVGFVPRRQSKPVFCK